MNIKQIKNLIDGEKACKGIPENDHSEGYVNYDTGKLLFNYGFNMPCDTYFHNVDDLANYEEDTPEHDQWEGRENNWEMCGDGKFLNYPGNPVIRCRFARPSYIQVLQWFMEKFHAKIDITSTKITVKNLHIPHNSCSYYVESWEYHVTQFPATSPVFLAWLTMDMIMQRFKTLAGDFQVREMNT